MVELLAAVVSHRRRRDHLLAVLMVTDILAQSTVLLVDGPEQLVEEAFGRRPVDGVLDLPGVMSRKKQVAPGLLAAAGAA